MSKIIWISTAVLSLIISIIINFNKSVSGFLIGSVILALIIFGILFLIIKSIQNIKEKNTKKAILFGVFSVLAIVIFSFGYLMFSSGGMCLTAITPAHFRTNILTGQCDFGGGSGCVSYDPWYFKQGCDLPQEKLIDVLKKSKQYEYQLNKCNRLCETNFEKIFCSEKVSLWGGQSSNEVRCDYLVNCDTISCD